MANTNVRITLELADSAAQKALENYIAKSAQADKSMTSLGKRGKDTFNEISVGIGKSIGVFDIFAGNLAANIVVGAFNQMTSAAQSLFQTFVVDGVKAAQEKEVALNDLNQALARSGQYSRETSQDIQAYAKSLQLTTGIADDVILKNTALLSSLTQLDTNGLKAGTKSALDLAAALSGKGVSLESATDAIAKAANGNITALTKMGLTIQKGTTDAETFANALRAVDAQFGGAAAGKINTFSGAVDLATHSFNSIGEEIGNLIVQNPAVIAALSEAGRQFEKLSQYISDNRQYLTELVANGVSIFLKSAAFLVTMVDAVIRGFQVMKGVIQANMAPLHLFTAAIIGMKDGFGAAKEYMNAFTEETSKNLSAFGASGDGALSKVTVGILEVDQAAQKSFKSISDGANGSIEPINNTAKAVKKLSEEQIKAGQSGQTLALGLIKQSEDADKIAQDKLARAKQNADFENDILKTQLDGQLITRDQYEVRRNEIQASYDAERDMIEQQRYVEEQARLQAARDQELIDDRQFLKAREQLEIKYEQDKIKRSQELAKRIAKIDKDEEDERRKNRNAAIRGTADLFGAMGDLAAQGGKKQFGITKAANLAQAITLSALAIQQAVASAPWPFNIPAITAASVASAANVSRIANAKPPAYAQGGIVPGSSFSGDNVQARVNSGEMILNRPQQAQLFKIANSNSMGSLNGLGGLQDALNLNNQLLARLVQISESGQSIQINGKEIFDVIRDVHRGGRRFDF